VINVDPSPDTAADLESMAATLEQSGRYRVLRRLAPLARRTAPEGVRTRLGLFLDTETTGLDPARDEIIELAMVPFTYGLDGEIYDVGDPFEGLRQPSKRIPPEITQITGIDDAMVEGRTIDPQDVAAFAAPAALVIAHNAESIGRGRGMRAQSSATSPPAPASSTSATGPITTVLPPSNCSRVLCRSVAGRDFPNCLSVHARRPGASGPRIPRST
jgi:DNA polymerase III epsilon subunit-like protein